MTETLIFGFNSNIISIIAEVGVAIATGILAYFTYQSVKTSKDTLDSLKNQVDFTRRDFENKQIELEKPQIIDQLQQIINPFSVKIGLELNQIDENLLLWKSKGYGISNHFFQFIQSEEFYNEPKINSRIGVIIYEISNYSPTFKELCQKRYNIYLSMADLFIKIYKDINEPSIERKISELIYKNNEGHEVYYESGYSDYVVEVDNFDDEVPTRHAIPVNDFFESIINIGIAKMLKQRIIPQDDYEKIIVSEFSSYENAIKNLLNVDTFSTSQNSFNSLIEELKSTNIQLINEIMRIKMEYRERYHLNDKEYWIIPKNPL